MVAILHKINLHGYPCSSGLANDCPKRPFHGWKEVDMGRFSVLCAVAIAVIVATGFSGTAYAITTFAQKFNMKCDACHTTVPQLNEFGTVFMAKGFVLPAPEKGDRMEDKPSVKTVKEPGKGGETAGVGGEAKDTGVAGTGSKESAGEETPTLPVVEPPPPTVVYKVPSRDGSVYFTDNPDRKGRPVTDQELETGTKQGELSSPPLFPRKKQAVRPPAQERRPVVKSTKPASEKPERYRNYAECMERQLDGAAQPESAQEMMDLFVTAEKKCAPYQVGKR